MKPKGQRGNCESSQRDQNTWGKIQRQLREGAINMENTERGEQKTKKESTELKGKKSLPQNAQNKINKKETKFKQLT